MGEKESIVRDARTAMAGFGTLSDGVDKLYDWPKEKRNKLKEAIAALCQTPAVWRRAWIMQEVSFAPQVILLAGHTTMSWAELETFLDTELWTKHYGIPDAFHGPYSHEMGFRSFFGMSIVYPFILAHQRRAVRSGDGGYGASLLDVLARFRYAEATDARDMIYGLLGLVTDPLDVRSDYGLSVRETYVDCSRRLIEHHDDLDLLCQGPWELFGNGERNSELPSWFPDYAHPGTSRILFAQRDIYSAGASKLGGPLPLSSSGSLMFDGIGIDTLATVRSMFAREAFHNPRLSPGNAIALTWMPNSLLQEAIDRGNASLAKYLTDEEDPRCSDQSSQGFEAYWRTLMVDSKRRPWRRLQGADLQELRIGLEEWRATPVDMMLGGPKLVIEEGRRVWKDVVDFEAFGIVNAWSDGWCFAISATGTYCMVPPAAGKGDHLVVLPGAKVPVVLRPYDADALRFVWVGACYVHGFMDGQALDPDTPGMSKRQYVVV